MLLTLFWLASLRFDGGMNELLRGRAAQTRVREARSVTTRAEPLLFVLARSLAKQFGATSHGAWRQHGTHLVSVAPPAVGVQARTEVGHRELAAR